MVNAQIKYVAADFELHLILNINLCERYNLQLIQNINLFRTNFYRNSHRPNR